MNASDDLRAALARLTTAERQTLAVRWTQNAEHWDSVGSALGPMWYALAALVLEIDRLERARVAAEVEPHTLREARRARR